MDIEYLGEHTFIGQLGHFLTILSFIGALLAMAAYFLSEEGSSSAEKHSWLTIGRAAFRIHSIAVLGIIGALFWMLVNQYFEYDYVWKHSNSEMPLRYILSCFWEGQEGSFLLWTFWHVVLGNVLIYKAKSWEGPVLTVFALVQVCLASMLLGIYVFDHRIGSSPFLLIRQLPENIGLPWTGMASYLTSIPSFADGRGLNPLLQNYWMTIHPPTLFFGFSSTLVPFAFAIAGLWRKQYTEWIKPALPWTFLAISILGIGILMGGAWAYEALSFGGFWAWDPVENASLVPWLVLVGGGHLMLINMRKGTSVFTTFLLVLSAFILIMYSTFLTRSGVLGDTSVHSFTGDGMMAQLVVYLLLFVALSTAMLIVDKGQRRFYWIISGLLLLIGGGFEIAIPAILLLLLISVVMLVRSYNKDFPKVVENESTWSREFWLFIGALVLTLSAIHITFTTSIPVSNLLLEPFKSVFTSLYGSTGIESFKALASANFAPPSEPIDYYNRWQIPFAFIITMLAAIGQFLAYKKTDPKRFFKHISLSLIVSLILTVLMAWWLKYGAENATWFALLFSATFAFVANAAYIWQGLKGKFKNAGPSLAHIGFALVMLGALISTSGSKEISKNAPSMDLRFLSKEFNNSTDVLLYKNDLVKMGDHIVSYVGKKQEGVNLKYQVDYFDVVPKTYQAGDIVNVGGVDFTCKADHHAAENFIIDQPLYWQALERVFGDTIYPAWRSFEQGDHAFRLQPFVQLNPKFGNVAEPSTRHWIDRDLYTHVRYADMEPDSAGTDMHKYMPPNVYEKLPRDTIVTPTVVIILDSLKLAQNQLTDSILGKDHLIGVLQVRVRDLYAKSDWTTHRPMIFYKGAEMVGRREVELPEHRIKIGIDKITQDGIFLNVYNQEFIVMQAIVFPGINILWIGCILLFLGTIMAVLRRFRSTRSR